MLGKRPTFHALVLVLAATSCGQLLEYPDQTAENSAALCSDGNDNDFDDQIDCVDSDCDGFCTEENAAECDDGRDNDGDGLFDAADPRCWLITPPKAERCAEATGVEMFETFDDWYWWSSWENPIRGAWSWRAWGNTRDTPLVMRGFQHESVGRRDGLAVFSGTAVYADVPGTSLGSLVRQVPFSGSPQGFELALSVSLPPGAVLRVGVVPVELAPSASAPLPGAENGLFSVSVDTQRDPAELVLTLAGSPFSKSITGCVGPPCTDSMGRLRVAVDDDGLVATFTSTSPDGSLTEVRPTDGRLESFPPSRLVFWGATPDTESQVRLDDVVLSVKPELPCGYVAPQASGSACEGGAFASALGQSVSVARTAAGSYCALVASSKADPLRGPSLPAAETLAAWGSPDGEQWTAYSALEGSLENLPEEAELIGAGIASDEDGLHAVFAYRGGTSFVDGERCDRWGVLEPGPALPEDAEAPSYVIAGGRHYLYYTLPPDSTGGRTLWRVARDALELPHVYLARLPKEVGAPVSVTRVGSSDLVLAYPRAIGGSNPSVGLLVANAQDWTPIPSGSIVEPPPRPDLWEGQGRLGFDDRGVLSASLAWDADGGFIFYGGVSTTGRIESARLEPVLAVGTARLARADQAFARTAIVPDRCGNGMCGAAETCASCQADCDCNAPVLLRDAFSGHWPWQLVTSDPEPTFVRYLSVDPPALNWLGGFFEGDWSWSILPLEAPIDADFELSFDWFVRWRPTLSCSVYVGLGAADVGSDAPQVPKAGVFAHMKKEETCVDGFSAKPFVLTELGSVGASEVGACNGADAVPTDSWQRVVLRRRDGELSVVTIRDSGCDSNEQRIVDPGVTSGLSAVLIGFGGDGFGECPPVDVDAPPMQGTIANLELRVLDGEP